MSSEHRFFHYNPDTGTSIPVQPVRLPGGREALVPLEVYHQIKRDIYGLGFVHPDCADATIRSLEDESDDSV